MLHILYVKVVGRLHIIWGYTRYECVTVILIEFVRDEFCLRNTQNNVKRMYST